MNEKSRPASRLSHDDNSRSAGRVAASADAFNRIPVELRQVPQWVGWRHELVDGEPRKPPYTVDGSRKASSTDPATWASFDQAIAAVKARAVDGIGVALTRELGVTLIDMDQVLDQGTADPAAAGIVEQLDSYTETSQSGNGLHVLARAAIAKGRRTKDTPWGGDLEIYPHGRFAYLTGDVFEGRDRLQPRQAQLDRVCEKFWPPEPEREPRPAADPGPDDRELLERMFAASNGREVMRLWSGDTSGHGDDDSRADLALLSHLMFWCRGDRGRVDALFRQSGLMRDKWDREDYRAGTLAKADSGRYWAGPSVNGSQERDVPSGSVDPDSRSSDEEQPFALDVATAREVCALPDPDKADELLGGLLMRRSRLVLGGGTGAGKTTMQLAAVAAAVNGSEFLDFQGAGGKALIIDAEQGLRTIKRRLAEAGLADSDRVDYLRAPDGLALDSNEQHVEAVERLLDAGGYDVVMADPLYKLHTGDSNAEREAVDLMRRFDGWRERYGFALIQGMHTRKPPPGVKFSMNELFGSTAFLRGAEVVLGLQRISDGYARLHFFKDRDGDLPVGDAWGLLFDREQGFRRDPKDGAKEPTAKDKVEQLLASEPGLTTDQLVEMLGYARKTINRTVKDLEAVGKGYPKRWYLPAEGPEEQLDWE